MKPGIPTGTRDYTPEQVIKRNYIFNTIREIFVKYGYQPIETPAMERLATLTGKYGEEGDKLLFKVLNNGDFLAEADKEALDKGQSAKLIPSISKKGLRYDLTVPFARYVVMHQSEITFPFKRYQIQPVWRGDRPARGRYREFYQCDVDVVGSGSLVYEAELTQIYDEVFSTLGLKVIIRINNRKILAGLAEVAGLSDQFEAMTAAIDKLDKIGAKGVRAELLERGVPDGKVQMILDMLQVKDLEGLKPLFGKSGTGTLGIQELETLFQFLDTGSADNQILFDVTLARGLNYYTGCIFEVVIDTEAAGQKKIQMGSVGGGGRYDDLTGIFGLKDVSGVGVSFGADRIYDVMEELGLFPDDSGELLKVIFIAFDKKAHLLAFRNLTKVRQAGINAEIYPEPARLRRQMKYANSRKAPFAILVGDEEMESGLLTLRDMESGKQEQLDIDAIIKRLR